MAIKAQGFDQLFTRQRSLKRAFGNARPWEVTSKAQSEDGVAYNIILEFGGAKVAPRPFFRPAIQQARSRAIQHLAAALRSGKPLQLMVELIATDIQDTARNLMEGPKSGRKYPHLKRRSSAPGEAPAIQSGQLHDNVKAKQL